MFWPSLASDSFPSRPAADLRARGARHVPVMVGEVVEYLRCRPGGNFVDLTVGGGGHAEAILKATAPDGLLLGVDRDPAALARAGRRLKGFGRRVKILHGALEQAEEALAAAGFCRIDGVLVDCGVSSHQLEEAQRGFSFSKAGPLDMRMDPTRGLSAKAYLERVDERELCRILRAYGEEPFARRIARAIVRERERNGLRTTADLAEAVRRAVPRSGRARAISPATRTFQAIRIAVNDELGQLERGVGALVRTLPENARLVVIAFHSLEDRIVKQAFRAAAAEGRGENLTRKPLRAYAEEVRRNPRARSACLRAFEFGTLEETGPDSNGRELPRVSRRAASRARANPRGGAAA